MNKQLTAVDSRCFLIPISSGPLAILVQYHFQNKLYLATDGIYAELRKTFAVCGEMMKRSYT
jgi:hypothetical protein